MKNKKNILFIIVPILIIGIIVMLFLLRPSKNKYYYCVQEVFSSVEYTQDTITKVHYDKDRIITKYDFEVVYNVEDDDAYQKIIGELDKEKCVDTYKKDGKISCKMQTIEADSKIPIPVDQYISYDAYKCELKED